MGTWASVGALIFKIGFWGILCYNYQKNTKIVLVIIQAPIVWLWSFGLRMYDNSRILGGLCSLVEKEAAPFATLQVLSELPGVKAYALKAQR